MFAPCFLSIMLAVIVPGAAQDVTIRTSVPLVVFSCSITDSHGKPITGLTSSDIELFDGTDSRQAKVDTVDDGLAPIALVVLIQRNDRSGSALGKIRKVGSMIPGVLTGENGQAAVLTFDSDVALVQDFTSDGSTISKAIAGVTLSDEDSGRMIDAVSQAAAMLAQRGSPERRIILIVGESHDRGSKAKLEDAQRAVQQAQATIYCLKYSAYLTPFTTRPEDYVPPGGTPLTALADVLRLGSESTMKALATLTGGSVQDFETKGKLENALMRVSTDLHSRYQISFTPGMHEPGFHPMSVRVANNANAVIHAPPGYVTTANSR